MFIPTFDVEELPGGITPSFVATLTFGLSETSRTKKKLSKQKLTLEEMLLAIIADRLGILVWHNTKDGKKGRNQPKSLFKDLTEEKKPKEELETFQTAEDFEEWYKRTRT